MFFMMEAWAPREWENGRPRLANRLRANSQNGGEEHTSVAMMEDLGQNKLA